LARRRRPRKEIIINSTVSETRTAILEDGKLVELFVEQPEKERQVGDIYLGKVVNVVRGMRAAFVDIGQKQDAFLHFSDIGERLYDAVDFLDIDSRTDGEPGQSRRPSSIPKEGQEILVQIIKEPISSKGSRITSELSIPGRFLVLVPNHDIIGVSRKIYSIKERRRLKKIARDLRPKGFGIILRTVAEGKTEQEIKADLDSLLDTWRGIEKRLRKSKPPTLIYKDLGMASSVIRDLFTPDIQRVVVDSRKLYKKIGSYLKEVAPNLLDKVEYYGDSLPIFDKFGIETEIEKSLARKVWTKSGGYIIFDYTEALVAIDVNSGKFMGRRGHDENALRINLEAGQEIARQLRLRDIGGIIVIDFIDMTNERYRRTLYEEFKRELRKDRAQVNVAPISEFGMIEMTRERIRPSLLFTYSEPCPTCSGTGRITSKATVLTQIERWVSRFKARSKERSLRLVVNPEIAKSLTGGVRSRLRQLMWKHWIKIDLEVDEELPVDEFRFFTKKENRDVTAEFSS